MCYYQSDNNNKVLIMVFPATCDIVNSSFGKFFGWDRYDIDLTRNQDLGGKAKNGSLITNLEYLSANIDSDHFLTVSKPTDSPGQLQIYFVNTWPRLGSRIAIAAVAIAAVASLISRAL